jgi:hypothetical protein
VHGARRNNPDQLAVAAQRETDVKQPPRIYVSESMQPELIRTMAGILYDQQGFIKEDLLGLCLAHVMLSMASSAAPRPSTPTASIIFIKTRTKRNRGSCCIMAT